MIYTHIFEPWRERYQKSGGCALSPFGKADFIRNRIRQRPTKVTSNTGENFMYPFSVFRRWIVIPALIIGLVFGLFASNVLIGGTALRKSEPNKQNKRTDSVQFQNSLDNLPVYFEENRGLTNDEVRYLARGNGGATLFLTAAEAVYVLRSPASVDLSTSIKYQQPKAEDCALAVHMKLSGANENAVFAGEEQLEHRTNYIIGSDSSGWQTGIPNYRRVLVNDIYDGVDMVWQGKTRGEVQYDFIVKPNANPAQIEWRIEGARNVSIDADGSLLIETELGTLRQGKPFSYQDADGLRAEVESGYVVSGERKSDFANRDLFTVKFEVGDYDRSKNLTIDPSVNLSNLAFSTLLGGNDENRGTSIAVDPAGNVYVVGRTFSEPFPTTAGSVDTSHNGGADVFVTKLNASGTALIYSTFIGGISNDLGTGMTIDSAGNAYLTGFTSSTDFPTTTGAFNTTFSGGFDVFVTKVNATGTALIYSTFIGGTSFDQGIDVAVDSAGNAYLTGITESLNYPATTGAFDSTFNGADDVFVTKVNATGTTLIYSTFIGSSFFEQSTGIAIDSVGNAYLTGFTGSPNYPTTTGAFDTTSNGSDEVFLTKFNQDGTALIYSTFIGGISNELADGIAIDSAGNAYLTGRTQSTSYPTTLGAFDRTHNGGVDVFVTKLNATGSALLYSTFIGGNGFDQGIGIAIDSQSNAYLTGRTQSTNYPTTTGAFDTTHNGDFDVFVTKLNTSGSALIYSTFIGGRSLDQAVAIATDSSGNAYLTGFTEAINYPTTPEAFQRDSNRGLHAFVSKFGDFAISGRVVDEAGLPLANVAVAMSGSRSEFILTDGQGFFGFTDTVIRGNFTVAATSLSLNFTLNNFQINPLIRNQEFVFLGRPITSGPNFAATFLGGDVLRSKHAHEFD
jgi:hypothetical protein